MYATVIVPTYNRKSILEHTISALLNQTAESSKYEVIVVDDCSVDNTAAYMRQIMASNFNVKYIQHKENRGRVITRNDGINMACGNIIIFLDDDNVPTKNFIEEHIKHYGSNAENKIAVMGNVSYAHEVLKESNFARFMQSRYIGNRSGKECSGINFKDLPARCFGTLNCSMRRVDLLEAGMFDEGFRYYGGEDEFLGQCLKKNGVRLIFAEGARSIHYEVLSLPRYKKKMFEYSKFGIRILKIKSPQYLENTYLKYLLPPSMEADCFRRLMIKVFIRTILNYLTINCLEKWLTITDNVLYLYFPSLFRIISAGWIIEGQKLKHDDEVFVKY